MNTTPDLSPLIKGVLALISIAIALGQYPRLERWARSQALEAVQWKQGLPYFFGPTHTGAKHHQSPITKPIFKEVANDFHF
jgi:hypothetical protein